MNTTKAPSETAQLISLMKQNNKILARSTSYIHLFLRGIVFGFAGVLGATIVVSLLASAVASFSVIPVVGDFLVQVDDYVSTKNPAKNSYPMVGNGCNGY